MVDEMKLTATYSLKITEKMKKGTDQLNPIEKFKMNNQIKLVIMRAIHNSRFDPKEFED